MIKRYIISLALAGLALIASGCGGGDSGDSAPVGSTITVNPDEVTVTDATSTVDTSTQFFQITVTNENGVPFNDVDITISYLWAVPNVNGLVQFFDGNTPVDSPLTVKTDSNGNYVLRVDFQSGGGLAYSGDLEVSSGSIFGSALFEVKASAE